MRKHVIIIGAIIVMAGSGTASRLLQSPPDSYAYVTGAKGYSTCTNGDCHTSDWRCTITALLPRKRLSRQPSGALSDLLRDAVTIHETLRDRDDTCDDALHSWVGANYASGDLSHAQLTLPSASWFSVTSAIRVLVVGVVLWAIWATLKERKTKRKIAAGRS